VLSRRKSSLLNPRRSCKSQRCLSSEPVSEMDAPEVRGIHYPACARAPDYGVAVC
jgi:hypothetical protein